MYLTFVFNGVNTFKVNKLAGATANSWDELEVILKRKGKRMTLIHLNAVLSQAFEYENTDLVKVTTAAPVEGFTDGCAINGFVNHLKEK